MTSPPPYHFENRGRSRRAALALFLIWVSLLLLIWQIDLSLWIAGIIIVFTLPAAWEFLTDPHATLVLSQNELSWRSGAGHGDDLPLDSIHRMRFDTRLDLSVRITMFLVDGRKIRLPHACTPPHRTFETALKARGVDVERHHFSFAG